MVPWKLSGAENPLSPETLVGYRCAPEYNHFNNLQITAVIHRTAQLQRPKAVRVGVLQDSKGSVRPGCWVEQGAHSGMPNCSCPGIEAAAQAAREREVETKCLFPHSLKPNLM